MADEELHKKINELSDEQRDLRAKVASGEVDSETGQTRLKGIEVELDRLWDLVRQRDAKREFGQNPNEATERPADVVEDYLS
ncbi:DUF2630 family protein [Nakamurella aerolata]|uniref:DUF2630 family protein n=1 Tax=Nakamurella aerolata TaxID=1656892 RepID=A0A849A917_9ACTN|nr:DUF2630 family protein [Nakamurella aerolata]NNG35571.1 DUF2630 family protein [Nakamurella aerolata]